jgi:hypothetical protein
MADSHSSHQTPSPSPSVTPADPSHSYEGFDPELPEHDRETGTTAKVSTVQVGASAAAAITSALAASFFGVAGTLIGAAVGSIVSTVAGALYADYLRRAGQRIHKTTTIVVQRMPPEKLATSPLRRLAQPGVPGDLAVPADPADPAVVPGPGSMRPVDLTGADQTVVVPVSPATEILAAPTTEPGTVVLDGSTLAYRPDETRLMPAVTDVRPGGPVDGAGARLGSGAGSGAGSDGIAADDTPQSPSWWRRRWVGMAAVGVAGFAISLAFITLTEGAPTPTVTVTGTATATPEATATGTPEATATATPEATATSAPSATATPQATQTAAPTASATPAAAGGAGAANP